MLGWDAIVAPELPTRRDDGLITDQNRGRGDMQGDTKGDFSDAARAEGVRGHARHRHIDRLTGVESSMQSRTRERFDRNNLCLIPSGSRDAGVKTATAYGDHDGLDARFVLQISSARVPAPAAISSWS